MRKEKPSLLNLLYLWNTSSFFDYPIPSRIPFPSPRTHARAHECASTTIPRTRAHNVGEKTTRKVARRNDRQILFPLLLPYSPTNSLPFPTNAQIKKAHLSAFLRNAESSGEQRVAFLGEKKEKKRKRNQRNPFFPPRSRTNPFKTPLQPSTALFPREFPSSFISKHERKKKKVGASRIEHATPTDSSLQRSLTSKSRRTIQTTLSLSLSLHLFALVFRSRCQPTASTSASWRTFLRTYMGPLYPACPRWWWMVAMVRPVHWRRCGGTSRSQRAEPP